jgi:hypothetical protein
MDIIFEQEVYYSNKEHLPLNDIAKSLLALEKAVAIAPRVLESLYEDVVAKGIEIFIDELHSGSLSEKLRYYLHVAFQKRIEDEAGLQLGTLEGLPQEKRQQIAAWLIAAGLLVALKFAADAISNKSPKTHIEQQINITLEAGGDITGIDPGVLRSALEQAARENPEAIKGAVGFIKPAKRDQEASIELDRQPYLSSQALAEIPSALPDDETQEKSIEFEDVEIYIRATDRDSGKRGWAATVPEFMDRRIRLHISPGIDLNFLAHNDVVVGNVSVFYSLDEKGNVVKPHAHLFSINEEATSSLTGGVAP